MDPTEIIVINCIWYQLGIAHVVLFGHTHMLKPTAYIGINITEYICSRLARYGKKKKKKGPDTCTF